MKQVDVNHEMYTGLQRSKKRRPRVYESDPFPQGTLDEKCAWMRRRMLRRKRAEKQAAREKEGQ